ncbi:hypothetical protein BMS3Bbin10_02579 [bacterium BMS3Bbin10]|nr:hypothetical protein BMS3Bbin10_02579 [bacterium BMS3Bbin10]
MSSKKPEQRSARPSRQGRKLAPAAARALAEAEERRKARARPDTAPGKETGGRGGPDPARYGDWEKDGIASDF